MRVSEIETAITKMPTHDVRDLMTWLSDYHEKLWDAQIENDLEAGRLDALLAELDREYDAGLARPL